VLGILRLEAQVYYLLGYTEKGEQVDALAGQAPNHARDVTEENRQ
jgi:hypothetical protein